MLIFNVLIWDLNILTVTICFMVYLLDFDDTFFLFSSKGKAQEKFLKTRTGATSVKSLFKASLDTHPNHVKGIQWSYKNIKCFYIESLVSLIVANCLLRGWSPWYLQAFLSKSTCRKKLLWVSLWYASVVHWKTVWGSFQPARCFTVRLSIHLWVFGLVV